MERTVSCKASLTPSQFSLSSHFTSCCLPLSAAETAGQETCLHPTVWLIHSQQIARGTSNTQAGQIIPSEESTARPQCTASNSLHTVILWIQVTGMTQTCINTSLTKAWFHSNCLNSYFPYTSSGPGCSNPASAALLAPAVEQKVFRNFTLHHENITVRKAELQVSWVQGVFCLILVTLFKYQLCRIDNYYRRENPDTNIL